jgi:hypothetical protein
MLYVNQSWESPSAGGGAGDAGEQPGLHSLPPRVAIRSSGKLELPVRSKPISRARSGRPAHRRTRLHINQPRPPGGRPKRVTWHVVFPAARTHFHADPSLNMARGGRVDPQRDGEWRPPRRLGLAPATGGEGMRQEVIILIIYLWHKAKVTANRPGRGAGRANRSRRRPARSFNASGPADAAGGSVSVCGAG